MMHPKTAAAAFGLASIFALAAPAAATPCTDLMNLKLEPGGITSTVLLASQDITSGSFTSSAGTTYTNLPPFCRVLYILSSSGDPNTSQFASELWLPESNWNGRYEGFGNGGFAGSISYSSLQLGLTEGFAAANTDMGTGIIFGCNSLFCGDHTGFGGPTGGLYGYPWAIRDFGYAATHVMTVVAKQIVKAYYAKPPTYSYFNGCSTGGQQALMESQRFPTDYDGILAGAPAHNRTHLHMAGPAVYEGTQFSARAYLGNAALALAHAYVLHTCTGRDGGLQRDDFLTQPNMCKADARLLTCHGAANEVPCNNNSQTAPACTCLSYDQAYALNRLWSGSVDDKGNQEYPGGERGTEEPVALTAANGDLGNLGLPLQQALPEPIFDGLMFWALGPNWVWQEMFSTASTPQPELAAEIATIDNTPLFKNETFAGILNANSVDLSAFNTLGHKIVMYQGYADPLIPTATSIDYFNAVQQADPNVNNYLRLFLAPGVWHCSGGPGPNAFGNLSSQLPPKPLNPSYDLLGALIAWVEHGQAPTSVIATKYTNDDQAQGIAFQRPLCLYPAHSAYMSGRGPVASSYACVPGQLITNQPISPIYGP